MRTSTAERHGYVYPKCGHGVTSGRAARGLSGTRPTGRAIISAVRRDRLKIKAAIFVALLATSAEAKKDAYDELARLQSDPCAETTLHFIKLPPGGWYITCEGCDIKLIDHTLSRTEKTRLSDAAIKRRVSWRGYLEIVGVDCES